MSVCAYVRARLCVRVCVRACACVRVWVGWRLCTRTGNMTYAMFSKCVGTGVLGHVGGNHWGMLGDTTAEGPVLYLMSLYIHVCVPLCLCVCVSASVYSCVSARLGCLCMEVFHLPRVARVLGMFLRLQQGTRLAQRSAEA